ncbi:ATP-binding protein [Desertihabitans aurantiacus]|uniref:ATP-binding protein n=1 Tax=Desertihabitans aurantiacus TaxID=2282477 RepID=UPI000DF78E3A|nr:ATP-binding protein [Desertihabitans aurantiacus]
MSAMAPWSWRLRTGVILGTAAVLVLVMAGVLLSDLPPNVRSVGSQVALVVGGLLAGFTGAMRATWTRNRRRRRAWVLLSAAGPTAAVGNLAALVAGPVPAAPVTLLVNVLLVVAMVFGVVGMSTFPSARHTSVQLARMILDGVVVGGALLFTVSVVVRSRTGGAEYIEVDPALLLLPLLDTVVATVAVLLILRSSPADRPRLALLGLGFGLYAVSDLHFVTDLAEGGHQFGTVGDLGWITGYLVLAATALVPEREAERDPKAVRVSSPLAGTILMFSLFIVGAVLANIAGAQGRLDLAARVIWMLTLVAVVARQILLVVDNDRLHERLARRVDERTTALRQATQRTSLMLSSVDDGIYGVDRDGVVVSVNPAATRLLGYPAEQLVGSRAHDTFHAWQDDGSPFPVEQCYITEAIRDGLVTTAEQDVYIRSDGQRIPVEVTASPLRDSGTIDGAVVVFRDMTERQAIDRMKDEFVSVVSHELRTPLTSIRGTLGLLASGALGALHPRAQRMAGTALDSSERLTRLINDILDLERLGSGTVPMELSDVEVAGLLRDAADQVGVLAAEAGLTIRIGDASSVVRGDRDRLMQTLLNLLSNAIKYSPPGEAIDVDAVEVGSLVEFRVTDRGRGIPADRLEQVFDRFQQVDSSDARDKGGTGLGLAISKTIIERLGGRIWAESDPGRRTSFHFTVPLAEVTEPAAGQEPVVLLTTDEYLVQIVADALGPRGHRVHPAPDREAALELLRTERPAALLVDAEVGTRTAVELLDQLRRRGGVEAVPVLVLAERSAADPVLVRRADAWLPRGFDEALLARTLSSVVRRHTDRRTVLVVEGEAALTPLVVAALAGLGLPVRRVESPARAMEELDRTTPAAVAVDIGGTDPLGRVAARLRRESRLSAVPLVLFRPDDPDADPQRCAELVRARVLERWSESAPAEPVGGTRAAVASAVTVPAPGENG